MRDEREKGSLREEKREKQTKIEKEEIGRGVRRRKRMDLPARMR